MTDLKQFIKQEAVAIIAFIAAIISCIFVPVTNYVSYIDTDLIGVMFGFMAVVAGFSVNNVFKVLSEQVAALAKDTRNLALALVFMVFFMSMLITNDVALIAFIPFTVMMYEKIDKSPVYVIVLQTIAANMGSAFTPFGNPQKIHQCAHIFICLKDDIFGVFLSDASRYGSKYADAFYRLHDDKKRAYFFGKGRTKGNCPEPQIPAAVCCVVYFMYSFRFQCS